MRIKLEIAVCVPVYHRLHNVLSARRLPLSHVGRKSCSNPPIIQQKTKVVPFITCTTETSSKQGEVWHTSESARPASLWREPPKHHCRPRITYCAPFGTHTYRISKVLGERKIMLPLKWASHNIYFVITLHACHVLNMNYIPTQNSEVAFFLRACFLKFTGPHITSIGQDAEFAGKVMLFATGETTHSGNTVRWGASCILLCGTLFGAASRSTRADLRRFHLNWGELKPTRADLGQLGPT